MSTKTLNITAIVFWGIVVGVIIIGVWQREALISWVQGATSSLNFPTEDLIGKVTGYIQEKPLESLLAVGSAGATIFGVYETIQKRRADNKTNEIALAKIQGELVSDSKINETKALAEQYRKQAEQYKDQLNDTTAQQTIVDLQTKLGLSEENVKRIQGDLNYIEKIKDPVTPEQFIQLIKEAKKIGQ